MKHTTLRCTLALLLTLALALSLAACGGKQDGKPSGSTSQGSSGKLDAPKTQTPAPDTTPKPDVPSTTTPDEPYVYSEVAQASIDGLYTNHWKELFAAAYLGYREEGDTSDLVEWLYNNCPLLPTFWPFLEEIPQEDIIGEYGDLYCVVPMDESVTFTVKSVEWETVGNGSTPHYSGPLYYAQVDRPFLMYVTHGEWRDETNMLVEYVQQDGFVGIWTPTYSTDTGRLETWENPDGWDTVLDFANLYDVGDYVPHLNDSPDADSEWLPPTDLGLAGTTWYSDNGWVLEFGYDENAENGMVLYQPVEDEEGTVLSPYYQDTWWMEDDSLCLGVYEGHCPFPLLISPSGEQLIVMQADDGSVLPFFEKGQTTVGLTLSYE